jgi:2-methylisocitrate lyase-like PEP mutase family enzyme
MASQASIEERRARFADLHKSGCFVMPNAWDVGSARVLASLGFEAIATTSAGHAASLGRMDQQVTFDELLEHVRLLVTAVDLPVSVDAERCFAEDASGVADNVERIAETGAAGFSIEDYHPHTGIDPVEVAAERVAAAAEIARSAGMTLTARAENHLYGIDDIDDTIARLTAYRAAGADVVYAPWLVELAGIRRVVADTGAPVNVLARNDAPGIAELREAGVRRISTGGALAMSAYGALAAAARELLEAGTSSYMERALSLEDRRAAFDG